jgi:hypothetical protein
MPNILKMLQKKHLACRIRYIYQCSSIKSDWYFNLNRLWIIQAVKTFHVIWFRFYAYLWKKCVFEFLKI